MLDVVTQSVLLAVQPQHVYGVNLDRYKDYRFSQKEAKCMDNPIDLSERQPPLSQDTIGEDQRTSLH